MVRHRLPLRVALPAALSLLLTSLPGAPVATVRAAEYTLESAATYDVQPDSRRIGVSVDLRFTNTTPNPQGQFSAFDEVKIAVHDQATEVAASDAEGDLPVTVAVESEVNVATVDLREQLRFEETAELQLRYTLPDTEDPRLRVRPSLIVFPAWSFGTSGGVRITLPGGYDVYVDGDQLTLEEGALVSEPIADPTAWLALVTAIGEPTFSSLKATIPLAGGTAGLEVRSFADDQAWGERMLELLERALLLLEEEIGLPYPGVGELVVTESVALTATGIGEPEAAGGGEILVAYDQPPFTAIHQVGHVWLSEEMIGSRWIREGMATELAERIAARVEVELPYDPAAVSAEQAASAFPLDSWSGDAGPGGEAFGYAKSWSVIAELRDRIGVDALRTVVARAAASVGPYAAAEIAPAPQAAGPDQPAASKEPLSTRSFLDHLETVGRVDLSDVFRAHVLTEADAALLDERAAARRAFDQLVAASDGWGAPDPVSGAMTSWSFDDAMVQIQAARDWLAERDAFRAELERAGLSAPDRLQQAYRAHGGGADAQAEINAEREVAESYSSTAEAVNAERTLVERLGLAGGADPAQQLRLANGRFADGDLSGSLEAIGEAQQLLRSAEASGFARLASALLVAVVLLAIAVLLFRRRRTYTRSR